MYSTTRSSGNSLVQSYLGNQTSKLNVGLAPALLLELIPKGKIKPLSDGSLSE